MTDKTITEAQIAAGAAVLDDDGRPVGRNTALMVFDAMSGASIERTAAPAAQVAGEVHNESAVLAFKVAFHAASAKGDSYDVAVQAGLDAANAGRAAAPAESTCPCCPIEVRDLFAVAHNAAVRAPGIYGGELKRAVEKMKPLIDAHFESREHSHPETGAAVSAATKPTACTLPPAGWSCTRAPGHEGPCAAVPSDDADWQRRALAAEESCRRLTAAINAESGPTMMGEPGIATKPAAAPAVPEDWMLVPKVFVTEVRRVAEIADSYSPSIDSIDEHGGEECEEPIWQIHHILYYAHAKLFGSRAAAPAAPVASADAVIAALRTAEAALADIGDADREPGDDVAWCEERAAEALPAVRAALRTQAATHATEGGSNE